MDRFFVEIEGRRGSFVAIHGGMTDQMKGAGRIVPGSGTDDLKDISGMLEFKSDARQDYNFRLFIWRLTMPVRSLYK